MSKKVRLFVLAGSLVVGLAIFAAVISATAPPSYVKVRAPLLFSEIPVEEPVVAENGETCWSAPYGSPPPDFCVHWPADGQTTIEARWTEEQLSLAQGSGNGVALWSDGAFAITYRDGTTENCASAKIANANVYRIEVPSGTTLWQGEIWEGSPPGCAYTASPTSTVSVLEVPGEEFPVTVTLKIAGQTAWSGVAEETGTITVPIAVPHQPWSLVETEVESAQSHTSQTHGWLWSIPALMKHIYLPAVLKNH